MTGRQCAEARRLLRWTQRQLAEAAGAYNAVVGRFERTGRLPKSKSEGDWHEAIRGVLEKAGVEFVDGNDDGPGVRLTRSDA